MKNQKKKTSNKAYGIIFSFLLIFFFFCGPYLLYSEKKISRASLSFSVGVYQPKENSFKALYGNNKLQYNFNLRYYLGKYFSVYSGLRYISCQGETTIVGSQFQEESYNLKFKIFSIPIGFVFSFPFKNLCPFFGGGVSYNMYNESWDQIDVSFEGKKWGVFLKGGVEYYLVKSLSLIGRIRYYWVPTGQSSALAENIDLGGIVLSFGIALHL